MIKTKQKTIKIDEIIEVICDKCNTPIPSDRLIYEGYGKMSIIFGYGSDYDTTTFSAQICDKCMAIIQKDIRFSTKNLF
jgi:ribosomal protein L40E